MCTDIQMTHYRFFVATTLLAKLRIFSRFVCLTPLPVRRKNGLRLLPLLLLLPLLYPT